MTVNDELFAAAGVAIAAGRALRDPDFPRFHVAPPTGRLNDPNGLIFHEGRYHAFYQFGPFFPERRLVFWGHATSPDLLHWEQRPPALAPGDPYDHTGVYSGGAIHHEGSVWLHYTGNLKHADGSRDSSQCAAVSPDLGSLRKLPANPLIPGPPPGYTAHFRDPQVWRTADGFRMCLGGQRNDETGCALLYRSDDLVAWTFEGELTFPGQEERFTRLGFMWECPNLIPMIDAVTGQRRTVLIFCPQGIRLDDGRGHNAYPAGYVVGTLDGTEFHDAGAFHELDRGFEFYAPQCFARPGGEDDPVILMGWAGNPDEDDQPSLADHGWVHLLTLPRALTLHNGLLRQRPTGGITELAATPLAEPWTAVEGSHAFDRLLGVRSFVLDLELDLAAETRCDVILDSSPASSRLVMSIEGGELTVDRGRTRYPRGGRRSLALPDAERVRLRVVQDSSITEIFVGDGEAVFTLRTYLAPGVRSVSLRTTDPVLQVRADAAMPNE